MRNKLNPEVTQFLKELNHPLRNEIEVLRLIILSSAENLHENIKWNGPNYCHKNEDRITLKINPPQMLQVIFHLGAKKTKESKYPLITKGKEILTWRGNDRAFATFKSMESIKDDEESLVTVVKEWINASSVQ